MPIMPLLLRADHRAVPQVWPQMSGLSREEKKSGLLIPSPSCWSTVTFRIPFTSSAMPFLLVKPSSNIFSDLPSARPGMLNLIDWIPWYTQTKGCTRGMILTFSPPHATVSSSVMIISLLVNCLTFLPTPIYLPFLLPASWNLPDHSEISIHLLWDILSFLVQHPPMI